jgi:hypothetical protein
LRTYTCQINPNIEPAIEHPTNLQDQSEDKVKTEVIAEPNVTDISAGKHYSYVCPICDLGLSSQEDLDAHLKSHQMDVKLPCQNNDCNAMFFRQDTLRSHMWTVHQVEKDKHEKVLIKCDQCDYT